MYHLTFQIVKIYHFLFFLIASLTELQSLQLQSNEIKKVNKGLSSLKKLEYLRLDQNKLEVITTNEIASCSNLIYLNVSHNKLESISVKIKITKINRYIFLTFFFLKL